MSSSAFQIPRPKISKEHLEKYTKDPEVVTLEFCFVGLTLANIFVLYRILIDVCPFPITVTWFQLLVGFAFAFILGESSREFPRCALFPPFTLNLRLYEQLTVPILFYLGMVTMSNVLLKQLPSVASFPVVVSLAVVLHHVSRFVGCGQAYVPFRWMALGVMLFGFLLSAFDRRTLGFTVLPAALLYAVFSATFRAWCLEKAMHAVEGRGNTLHNHQTVMGLVLLPILAVLMGEWRIFSWMPLKPNSLFTWQAWGCLISAGVLPFVKNVVANRMIRRTGQAPWRFLELLSMLLVFLIGGYFFDNVSAIGTVAFVLVLSGRLLSMLDVLSTSPEERRRTVRQEANQSSAFDGAGNDSDYKPLDSTLANGGRISANLDSDRPLARNTEQRGTHGDEPAIDDLDYRLQSPKFGKELSLGAVKPFLVPIDEE